MTSAFADAAVRFVSWNVHGLGWPLDLHLSPFSSVPRKGERIPNILRLIEARRPVPDFIALQEVWGRGDAELVSERLKDLKYHATWGGGGTGLLTAVHSRWTVENAETTSYGTRGKNSDRFKKKGFQYVICKASDGPTLVVFNTHLQSQYGKNTYDDVRGGQVDELTAAATAQKQANPSAQIIVCGDFNTFPYPVDWTVYKKISTDPWRDLTVEARARCGCETNFSGRTPTSMESWIDFMLLFKDSAVSVSPEIAVLGNRAIDDPFSDHQGLGATLVFKSTRPIALLPQLLAWQALSGRPSRRLWLSAMGLLTVDALASARRLVD